MPKKKYPLDNQLTERLEIVWEGGAYSIHKNIRISLDGEQIATIQNPEELRRGWEQEVAPNVKLRIQLHGNNVQRLQVFINDKDVTKPLHVVQTFKDTYFILFLFGGLHIAIWIMTSLLSMNMHDQPRKVAISASRFIGIEPQILLGWMALVVGLLYIYVGREIRKRNFPTAVVIILLAAQLAYLFLVDQSLSLSAILVLITTVIVIFRSYQGIAQFNQGQTA